MHAPTLDQYPVWAETYISKVEGNIFEILQNQIVSLPQLFNNNAEKANFAYAPNKWTVKQVLGHMIDTERILVYRLLSVARNEKQELISFDEDEYVANAHFATRELTDMTNEFAALRTANMYFFKSLGTAELNIKGKLSDNREITAKALLFVVAGHVIHHTQVLKERYDVV